MDKVAVSLILPGLLDYSIALKYNNQYLLLRHNEIRLTNTVGVLKKLYWYITVMDRTGALEWKQMINVKRLLLLVFITGAWGMDFVSSSPFSLLSFFFKIFIIIRFSSFDNISRRHTSWIIRVFCVHSFSTETGA